MEQRSPIAEPWAAGDRSQGLHLPLQLPGDRRSMVDGADGADGRRSMLDDSVNDPTVVLGQGSPDSDRRLAISAAGIYAVNPVPQQPGWAWSGEAALAQVILVLVAWTCTSALVARRSPSRP